MKKLYLFILLVVLLFSCKKSDSYFIPKYMAIPGEWNTYSIARDSSGTWITYSSPFNRLIINDNLEYQIFLEWTHNIESGTIMIINQTNDKLEIFFDPDYPAYSSFAGSHLFGFSNVILVSLSGSDMILRSVKTDNFPEIEFHFKKN